ncbi:hypothetical protein LP421_16885 [Rhizobium sp. RCAM05350]|nr:hypothetical protein LP421_16885 [Rhizobium sp. RCAM05350]
MEVKGAGWNLGSNAIHFIDLAEHVLGDRVVALDETGLDPTPQPARIPGCVDLFGTLRGNLAGGGTIAITQDRAPGDPVSITFFGGGESWRVEEGAKSSSIAMPPEKRTYRHSKRCSSAACLISTPKSSTARDAA